MKNSAKIVAFFMFFTVILQFFANFNINKTASAFKKMKESPYESMITIEASTGRILYAKDENKKLPMASTTKILTAIIAIENTKDIDKKHEIPKSAVGVEGSSIYLKKGEHLSIRELLYGLMLRSGNDSAVAIAEIVSGSVEKFVQAMNKKCEKLGLTNTHIVTVNGLHNENHYSSAADLAKLTAYALNNETFAEIVSTKEKCISAELDKKYGYRYLKNKNKLLNMIRGADGVKTGYTTKAGKCFVGSATRNGMKIICVVLNSKSTFNEAADLIEKAFAEYKMTKLFSKGSLFDAEIKNGKHKQMVPVIIPTDIYYPMKDKEMLSVTAKVEMKEKLSAPIKNTDVVGELKIRMENDLLFSQKLYTIKVDKIKEENYFKKLVEAF